MCETKTIFKTKHQENSVDLVTLQEGNCGIKI